MQGYILTHFELSSGKPITPLGSRQRGPLFLQYPTGGHISASSATDENCMKGKGKVQRWRSNMEQRTLMEAKNQWRWPSVQRGRTDKSHPCGKLNGRVTHPLCEDGWIAGLNHVFQFLIGCRSPSCRQVSKTRMPSVIIIIIRIDISTVHIYIPGSSMPRANITHIVYWSRDCYQFKK